MNRISVPAAVRAISSTTIASTGVMKVMKVMKASGAVGVEVRNAVGMAARNVIGVAALQGCPSTRIRRSSRRRVGQQAGSQVQRARSGRRCSPGRSVVRRIDSVSSRRQHVRSHRQYSDRRPVSIGSARRYAVSWPATPPARSSGCWICGHTG